jgi:toxin CcdB
MQDQTTQHDLFANPNRAARSSYPFVAILQASVVGGQTQVVAPLIVVSARVPRSRLLPIVEHDGATYAVMLGLISHLSARLLPHPVGSIARYRVDLVRALDWLFFGI